MLVLITESVAHYGPWLVMAMTFAETALIIGLVIPAEPTIILAMALALAGEFPVWAVAAAAIAGAALGDSTGFWLGRTGGRRLLRGPGRLARAGRRQEARASALLEQRPGVAISLARLVPFVRTLMPLVSGSTNLGYGRFLAFDVVGVAGWSIVALGAAYLTGLGWEWASRTLGVGLAALLVGGLVLIGWQVERRVSEHAVPTPPPDPEDEDDAHEADDADRCRAEHP